MTLRLVTAPVTAPAPPMSEELLAAEPVVPADTMIEAVHMSSNIQDLAPPIPAKSPVMAIIVPESPVNAPVAAPLWAPPMSADVLAQNAKALALALAEGKDFSFDFAPRPTRLPAAAVSRRIRSPATAATQQMDLSPKYIGRASSAPISTRSLAFAAPVTPNSGIRCAAPPVVSPASAHASWIGGVARPSSNNAVSTSWIGGSARCPLIIPAAPNRDRIAPTKSRNRSRLSPLARPRAAPIAHIPAPPVAQTKRLRKPANTRYHDSPDIISIPNTTATAGASPVSAAEDSGDDDDFHDVDDVEGPARRRPRKRLRRASPLGDPLAREHQRIRELRIELEAELRKAKGSLQSEQSAVVVPSTLPAPMSPVEPQKDPLREELERFQEMQKETLVAAVEVRKQKLQELKKSTKPAPRKDRVPKDRDRPLDDKEKAGLQEKIDTFSDEQLERSFGLLREIGAIQGEDDEVDLDIDRMVPWQQRRFLDHVNGQFKDNRNGPGTGLFGIISQ